MPQTSAPPRMDSADLMEDAQRVLDQLHDDIDNMKLQIARSRVVLEQSRDAVKRTDERIEKAANIFSQDITRSEGK